MTRRTKKQKQDAKRNFTITWEPSTNRHDAKKSVKGQIKNQPQSKKLKKSKSNYTRKSAKDDPQAQIKSDIIKSIIIASLILGVEVMIYLKNL